MEISFVVSGPFAEATAQDLQKELGSLFVDASFVRSSSVMSVDDGKERPFHRGAAETIAIVSLIVSLPGSIVAVMDLSRRLEFDVKMARLGMWAKQLHVRRPETRIEVKTPTKALELREFSIDSNAAMFPENEEGGGPNSAR